MTASNIDDLGRPALDPEPAFPAEQRLVGPERCDHAELVRVVNQRNPADRNRIIRFGQMLI